MDTTERELREMLADHRLVKWPTEPQWNAIWLAANAKGFKGSVSAAVHGIAPDLLDPDWAAMLAVDPAEAKVMWSEICVRNSVSPFVETNTPFTAAQKAEAAFNEQYNSLIAKGWTVLSNGPDGMQLRAPKKMKRRDQILLAVGVLTLVAYGLGVLFIAVALVSYYVYSDPPMVFLRRPETGASRPR